MRKVAKTMIAAAVLLVLLALLLPWNTASAARGDTAQASYKVVQPITQDNLTIFPVIAPSTHETAGFITLDEGLRSGDVIVTETGGVAPLMRRRRTIPRNDSARVNNLSLVNNSDRPLILLAGEIVTGGKQDRVIGKDRLIPAQSDPVDLSVFCVEPGRWVEKSEKFGGLTAQMAQPSVRNRAMADKDQGRVWDEVRKSNAQVVAGAPARVASELAGTSSYAGVMDNVEVKAQVDAVAAPVVKSYESIRGELHKRNAIGVVVAVNGRIIWADLFASPALLEKYWPKLVRSYAAEAVTMRASYEDSHAGPNVQDAQKYLNDLAGYHEVSETEPGVFRYAEGTAPGFKVFSLTSLLPKTGFELHVAKMRTSNSVPMREIEAPMMQRPRE